jgi:integrase
MGADRRAACRSGVDPGATDGVPDLGGGAPAVRGVPPDRDAGPAAGEACGWQWGDFDLDDGVAYISRQLQQDAAGRLKECPLKTETSRRAVALDPETVIVLRAHRSRQCTRFSEAAIAAGEWVFTRDDGGPLSPDFLTSAFISLVGETDLPPVRLHDLRHGAATLMQRRGVASDATFRNLREDCAVRDSGVSAPMAMRGA